MKRTDFLKIILGLLLGAIGLMLYKAFSVPNMPELADGIKLVVEKGESTILIVNVEDDCTANWYTQEVGGEAIKKNATSYNVNNLESDSIYFVEAVSEKNARKVSRKRLKIEVKLREAIVEDIEPQDKPERREVGSNMETSSGEKEKEKGKVIQEQVLRDEDQDGVMSNVDKNDHEFGPIENSGVPFIIDLMIKQQSDPNKFTINPKFWEAITNNEVQLKYTCLECGEEPLLTTIYRNDTYGVILMGSNMNYNGAPGIIKIINFNLKKYFKLKDNSNYYKTPKGLSCKGY